MIVVDKTTGMDWSSKWGDANDECLRHVLRLATNTADKVWKREAEKDRWRKYPCLFWNQYIQYSELWNLRKTQQCQFVRQGLSQRAPSAVNDSRGIFALCGIYLNGNIHLVYLLPNIQYMTILYELAFQAIVDGFIGICLHYATLIYTPHRSELIENVDEYGQKWTDADRILFFVLLTRSQQCQIRQFPSVPVSSLF